ncbi:hypothetical protein [Actinomadura sp. HBU206391]|uniref:hypothetical protein n=1 Tax=Actinomadura sp. HBU206391 TaxID=2731692 RepID=UPI00164F4FF3|nr:hypothetical protein [Actinomadura sp. HBU206391]MBC6461482.1 hypothetical protein [Actinomadura sp. HBU206391]
MSWATRDAFAVTPRGAAGLLLLSPDSEIAMPLGSDDQVSALSLAAAALTGAGLDGSDRVVVALNNDGELTGSLIAQAAASVADAAASVGPRGRMRLHRALETVRATTLITTPTGAMDLLARLHLEFLIDPLDLELRHVLLTGEIASPGTQDQLASEFDASVTDLYTDPFAGVPVAYRRAGQAFLTPVRDGLLGLAPLDKDAVLDPPYPEGLGEVVACPDWHSSLRGSFLRTGQVVRLAGGEEGLPAPAHTVGEHVLVRGRWVSVPRIAGALSRVDGISHWELRISRAGTLDAAALHVTFDRGTLIENPMWRSRIAQALAALTPVSIEVVVEPEISADRRPGSVTDLRGHHLARDRTAVAGPPGP